MSRLNGIAMPRHPVSLLLLGVVLAVFFVAPPALAQPQRTFVASTGSDSNPCSRTLPCRSFGTAVAAVAAGGEVVALDSAGYGPFTVSKAVTVVAPPGVHAGITVFSGDGITITAGASDVVVLRGLTLIGLGGSEGILFTSGAALHVERFVISGFAEDGILFTGPGQLFVKDTIVRENTNAGILISPSSGTASASIEHSRFEGTGGGVAVFAGGRASIHESVASGNGGNGFSAVIGGEINVHNSLVANNSGSGIACAGTGATARVANSIVTDNVAGLSQAAGCTFESLGTSLVRGNGMDTSGTITPALGQ